MSDFKPLDMQRAVRADNALSKTDKPFLWAAVLRADNKTRKVRASLELLAKDTGWHPNTAYKTFSDDNHAVMRYFEKVERTGRSVQLWFRPAVETTPAVDSQNDESTREGDSSEAGGATSLASPHRKGTQTPPEVESDHAGSGPSAPLCPSSASIPLLLRPSLLTGDGESLEAETSGEALSGRASEVDAESAATATGPSVFDLARMRMQTKAAPTP